jgi:hypothetical protein
LNFNTEFKDFMANNAYEIAPMLASLAGILSSTTLNPDSIDAAFDVDKRPEYVPPGVAYIAELVNGHPLVPTIFPTEENVTSFNKNMRIDADFGAYMHTRQCRKIDDGTATFNPFMLALGLSSMKKNINLVYQSLNTINDAFVKNHSMVQREANMTKMTNWFHISGVPALSNIQVEHTGDIVGEYAQDYDFIGFGSDRIKAYANQKATQDTLTPNPLTSADKHAISTKTRAGEPLPEQLNIKYRNKPIELLYQAANEEQSSYAPQMTPEQGLSDMQRKLQGKILRQFTPDDVINNTGASLTNKLAGTNLYDEIHEGELGKKLDMPLYTIDKENESALHEMTEGGTKGLSVLLLGLSLANLVMVRGEVVEEKSRIGKMGRFFEALFYTGYALEVVYVKFQGMDQVKNMYDIFESDADLEKIDWVTEFQHKISKLTDGIELTPIAVMGIGACIISCVFSLADMLDDLKERNYGSAGADLLDIAADVLEILAILAEYAAKDSIAYAFLDTLGPLGWIASLVSLVATIVAYECAETPLEYWTKHCPLSNILPEHNMNEYESCTSLLSILQSPSAIIKVIDSTENKGYQSIEVYIKLSCFNVGNTNLQVETTWERECETSQVVTAANSVIFVKNIDHAKQTFFTPSAIKQCCDAQGRVVAMRYIYNNIPVKITHEREGLLDIDTRIQYRTRVRLYSEKHKYALPYVTGSKKLPEESSELTELKIDTTQAGWCYAELATS